jgi:polyisoprenoid-binding protein YceI
MRPTLFSNTIAVSLLCLAGFAAQAQTSAPTAKKPAVAAAAATSAKPAEPAKAAAPASKSVVDLSKSSVSAVFKQTGVSSEGPFRKFNITLDYDAAKVAETKAQVEIDMSSFDIGDEAYNAEILKKDWFNAPQFPKASFVSSSVKAIGPGKLEASGKLTIKGKSLDITVPVTYTQVGSGTVFEGVIPIKRLAFNIGEGEWKDTSVVEDEVKIKFKISLSSK